MPIRETLTSPCLDPTVDGRGLICLVSRCISICHASYQPTAYKVTSDELRQEASHFTSRFDITQER